MRTFDYPNATVKVYNCPLFRLAEVYKDGRKVSETLTSTYGKRAADIAISEALRFRCI